MITGKTIALTRWDLCWQSNVSASLYAVEVGHSFSSKEQESFNFIAVFTICSDLRAPQNKVSHVPIVSPSICHEVMGQDAMKLVFWMLSFKPTFSLSAFTFIKGLFSFCSLSAIVKVKSLSRVWLFVTPVAYQAPPSMGFSKQKYWSGLPFLSPGDFPDPGVEPRSSAL